jgi:hypothetical protein
LFAYAVAVRDLGRRRMPGAAKRLGARDLLGMSVTPVSRPPGSGTPPDDFEVLPPEGKRPPGQPGGGVPHQALSQLIAYLMDNILKVPGTKKGIGLNPILDLLPVFGDGAATIMQMLTIMEGARRGVPKIVLARMGVNILLNGAIGMLPGFGEAFAWWFRPSSRNYQLLLKHAPQAGSATVAAAPARRTTAGDFIFVFGLLAVVLIGMGMFIALGFLVLKALWHAAFPVHG